MQEELATPNQNAVELKGGALPVISLRLKTGDPQALYPALEALIEQNSVLLQNGPVLIDVSALGEEEQIRLDFSYLRRFLVEAYLVPVGVRGALASQKENLFLAGLLAIASAKQADRTKDDEEENAVPPLESSQAPEQKCPEPELKPEPKPEAKSEPRREACGEQIRQRPEAKPQAGRAPALIISQQVRAGQQICAPDGDLIILGSVNAGSELFAAGNIHVYGALRGRALAGVHGDTSARIFTLQGNPELLAIAGEYLVNEDLPKKIINQAFAASWSEQGLHFQFLGSFV